MNKYILCILLLIQCTYGMETNNNNNANQSPNQDHWLALLPIEIQCDIIDRVCHETQEDLTKRLHSSKQGYYKKPLRISPTAELYITYVGNLQLENNGCSRYVYKASTININPPKTNFNYSCRARHKTFIKTFALSPDTKSLVFSLVRHGHLNKQKRSFLGFINNYWHTDSPATILPIDICWDDTLHYFRQTLTNIMPTVTEDTRRQKKFEPFALNIFHRGHLYCIAIANKGTYIAFEYADQIFIHNAQTNICSRVWYAPCNAINDLNKLGYCIKRLSFNQQTTLLAWEFSKKYKAKFPDADPLGFYRLAPEPKTGLGAYFNTIGVCKDWDADN